MIRTVIFDFDQTLVDSHCVAHLREERNWDGIVPWIPRIRLCEGIGEVLAYLEREGIRTGIVSNSPRDRYIAPICASLGLAVSTIIGYEDCEKRKPYPDGLLLAVAKLWADSTRDPEAGRKIYETHRKPLWNFYRTLGVEKGEILGVGDVAHDIAAANRAEVGSVGALWGADEENEVVLAEPKYLCATPAELVALIEHLKTRPVGYDPGCSWAQAAAERYQRLCREWVQLDGRFETRDWVTASDSYFYLRTRHKGNWSRSLTNSYIEIFKQWPVRDGLGWLRNQVLSRFARELSAFLPQGATYLFVPPSQARGDPEFNPRFDHLQVELQRIRPDLVCIEPIYLEASRPAAHLVEGKAHRSPQQLMEHFRWNPAQWTRPARIYMVDDVLTLGTSFTAIQRFVLGRIDHPCQFVGAAWALHG